MIAEKDLEIRGPGDFFGTRQWGMPAFRVGHLIRDRDLLEQARARGLSLRGRARGRGRPRAAGVSREGRLGAAVRARSGGLKRAIVSP